MQNDLDALMEQQGLEALVVLGPAQHNPAMVYLTGGAHLTDAILIKRRGAKAVLFYNPMERDEAARTGLETRDLGAYPFSRYLHQAQGDRALARALRFRALLRDLGITQGRVGLAGRVELGPQYDLFVRLQHLNPDIQWVSGHEVLLAARKTKSAAEIERIRRMGQITTAVVGRVADFLSSQRGHNGLLVDRDGQPITIGQVKRLINRWLAEAGAENPEGTIFAQGYDAGVPHSTGNDAAPLRLGEPIVFDIFPCEAGGGYFYDFTRTWCLGYATDEAQALYEDVLRVYRQIMTELEIGAPCKAYQRRTCELFEAQGHPTICRDARTQVGYVHSLGHGLGLDVHEAPTFGSTATEADRLLPGVVVTIEPGLYYPEKHLGCRLEDTVAVTEAGFEVLADFPLDLVIPVRGMAS